MPRKDPFTGCSVLTLPEFFASEAKAEGLGRTGSEVMAETFDEIGREEEAHAARINQPDEARSILNSAMKECWDPGEPDYMWWRGFTEMVEIVIVRVVVDTDEYEGCENSEKGAV